MTEHSSERSVTPPPPEAPPPRALVELKEVSKSFGAIRALRSVSMTIYRGEILGVCGHNGAGKSTLMRLLVGSEQLDEGEILFRGEPAHFANVQAAQRSGIAIVDQELSLVPTLTVAENLVLANVGQPLLVNRRARRARARELLDHVGLQHVSPDMPTSELSLGEQQLVEIARLLGRSADLLILDEPTATLSSGEIQRVFDAVRALAAEGKTVIFVSHRLDEVLALCHRVAIFRDGQVVSEAPAHELDKPRLSALMLGAQGRELSAPVHRPSHESTIELRDVSILGAVRNVTLTVSGRTIVGFAGQVGAGASELLRGLGGLIPITAGEVLVGGKPLDTSSPGRTFKRRVEYLTNDRKREGLFLSQRLDLNLTATRLKRLRSRGFVRRSHVRHAGKQLAGLAQIPLDRLDRPVTSLSGGNQQKTLVGRCLEADGLALLLLDDPTRGVDVGGRAELHKLIRQIVAADATVFFASTDLNEILELSDVVVTMFDGELVSVRPRAEASAATVLAEMTHRQHAPAAASGTPAR